ncbi:MAG: PQQ-dependent sugar dehydrogenase [Chloroflexi bacterium]|nr:PQQ-dependent sugar dehydrogenase [Chloroflexota bacterium]MDA1297995.1 PQQ-dependent sugar dehydrogenase [Chloroflexota bacterium]
MALAGAFCLGALALASCNNGNESPRGGSGIRQETPAPGVEPTATALPATPPLPAPEELALERVFGWYDPQRPTHLEEIPDGSGSVYVSEQDGRLVEIIGDPGAAEGVSRVVLNIEDRVTTRVLEEGFLGFAFHPGVSRNGRVFVYYSAASPRRSVISEFRLGDDGEFDPTSERIVLEVSQPFGNHNGGMLLFGPDGFLYISLGDGGGAGDRSGNGQNLATLLGSVLRIDVDAPGVPYAVPPDNPFTGMTAANGEPARGEIWAFGLRNPWRLAFDPATGELWAADVGQNDVEEVDLIVRGGNYGWNIMEGDDCYKPEFDCGDVAPPGLIGPVASYTHRLGCSVSGGYVYRGQRLPSLKGAYVFGDFCSGSVWALRRSADRGELNTGTRDSGTLNSVATGAGWEVFEIVPGDHQVPAFGQTLDGEVYVLTYSPGIFRFVEK